MARGQRLKVGDIRHNWRVVEVLEVEDSKGLYIVECLNCAHKHQRNVTASPCPSCKSTTFKVSAAPRWICVNERLPEDDGMLAYRIDDITHRFGKYNPIAKDFVRYDKEKQRPITHWFPIEFANKCTTCDKCKPPLLNLENFKRDLLEDCKSLFVRNIIKHATFLHYNNKILIYVDSKFEIMKETFMGYESIWRASMEKFTYIRCEVSFMKDKNSFDELIDAFPGVITHIGD